MSWSCDECGGDRYENHASCQTNRYLSRIADAVEKIADALTSTEAVNFAKQASVGGVESPAQSSCGVPDCACQESCCR